MMTDVKIDFEKMQFETSVSIEETYKQLADYYKGNDEVLTKTFPIMVLPESNSLHKKRFIAEENGLYFYTNYPWTFKLIKNG